MLPIIRVYNEMKVEHIIYQERINLGKRCVYNFGNIKKLWYAIGNIIVKI